MLAILLLLAAGAVAQGNVFIQQLAERKAEERHETLLSHGINRTPAALIQFLERGFSESAMARGLPERPEIKSDVINAAIQQLGFLGDKSAVPVLIAILKEEYPPGIQNIVAKDVEPLPIRMADGRYDMYMKFFRYNSIVALGLIGDVRAIPPIKKTLETDNEPAFMIEGAIALALLGDPDCVELLVDEAGDPKAEYLGAVYEAIFVVTGRNYGVHEYTSIAKRRELYGDLLDWTHGDGKEFRPQRAEVLRRRLGGIKIPDPPSGTLRGALKDTRTFEEYDTRYAARQFLRKNAPGAAEELRAIAEDAYEDVDIRMAAMEWYAAAEPKEARKLMTELAEEDENAPIRQRAKFLLPEIEKALAAQE